MFVIRSTVKLLNCDHSHILCCNETTRNQARRRRLATSSSNMVAGVFRQFRLLVWKNFRLQRRRKLCTCCEYVVPLLFTLLLVLMRTHMPMPDPKGPLIFDAFPLIDGAYRASRYYHIANGLTRNWTLLYTPVNPTTEDLMARFIRNFNAPTTTAQGLNLKFWFGLSVSKIMGRPQGQCS